MSIAKENIDMSRIMDDGDNDQLVGTHQRSCTSM